MMIQGTTVFQVERDPEKTKAGKGCGSEWSEVRPRGEGTPEPRSHRGEGGDPWVLGGRTCLVWAPARRMGLQWDCGPPRRWGSGGRAGRSDEV